MQIQIFSFVAILATSLLAAERQEQGLEFDFGADLRVRQEMMDNIPGNPGGIYSVSPAARGVNKNQIRIRPRVWFELEGGPFRLYSRIADEFREYPVRNGVKRDKRA